MSTLLLRLAAPLQSWGIDSKYNFRTTEREPSKSGVIGLLAAALGIRRDDADALKPLVALRYGYRVDQEGEVQVDYQNVQGRFNKRNHLDEIVNIQTWRYYLADAVFLVGVESANRTLLESLDDALYHPAFPLFLGRRSCPPTLPLNLGIREKDLAKALKEEEWKASDKVKEKWIRKNPSSNPLLRIAYEPGMRENSNGVIHDQPLTFNPVHRQYGYRGCTILDSFEYQLPEHDPMAEL